MKNFKESLTASTAAVLSDLSGISELSNFTLVGGSAISIHLQHRLSEDLDFFTWLPELNNSGIENIFNHISQNHSLKIINTYNKGVDALVDSIKVTFFANDWDELKKREKIIGNSYLADAELLTAMKVNTLSLRAKFRDYYDLYVIANELFSIQKIFEISSKLLPGLSKKIFAMQLVYTDDIDDESIEHLNPRYKTTLDEIRSYFEKQLKILL